MRITCTMLAFALLMAAANGQTDDSLFIHHSTGQLWLNNDLHNALVAKPYVDERNDITYGTDLPPDSGRPDSLAPVPGDLTDMHHWLFWFNDYFDGITIEGCADGVNRIVMFKSCFPNSNLTSDGTEPGDPFSTSRSLVNYKAIYRHPNGPGNTYSQGGHLYKPLEDVFSDHPDTLFIVVTAPPLHFAPVDATTDANAHRARVFNSWLKNTWHPGYAGATGLQNVAVFDWFDVLAYPDDHALHPNRLRDEYGGASGDSHPNSIAMLYSTEVFATNPGNFIDLAWNAFDGSGSGDNDGDGLPDAWELAHGLNPGIPDGDDGPDGDPDGDGLSNLEEFSLNTHPRRSDTDGDGLPDGWEVAYSLDPLNDSGEDGRYGDPDGDTYPNIYEYWGLTNPQDAGDFPALPINPQVLLVVLCALMVYSRRATCLREHTKPPRS